MYGKSMEIYMISGVIRMDLVNLVTTSVQGGNDDHQYTEDVGEDTSDEGVEET